jgi:hypothetical protein
MDGAYDVDDASLGDHDCVAREHLYIAFHGLGRIIRE